MTVTDVVALWRCKYTCLSPKIKLGGCNNEVTAFYTKTTILRFYYNKQCHVYVPTSHREYVCQHVQVPCALRVFITIVISVPQCLDVIVLQL